MQGVQAGENGLPVGVPLLFIDASAPQVQAGVWQSGQWLAYRCMEASALEEIFRSVSLLLKETGLAFGDLRGFVHNEGPGSILGIRLAAMALRIWSMGFADEAKGPSERGVAQGISAETAALPVWAVRSLPLLAAKVALGAAGSAGVSATEVNAAGTDTSVAFADAPAVGATAPAGVFSEFRQGLWNWYTPCAEDVFGDGIEVIETEELGARLMRAPARCWHLRHRKNWEAPPVAVREVVADLGDCPQVLLQPGLLRRVAEPEALLTRAPEFKTASGERHRGAQQPSAGPCADAVRAVDVGGRQQRAKSRAGEQLGADGVAGSPRVCVGGRQPGAAEAEGGSRVEAAPPTGKPLSGRESEGSEL